MFFGKYLGFL